MRAVAEKLSLADFDAQYANREEAYEFWQGEAIAKAVPTWIHSRLQVIIGALLQEAGYYAGSDAELRIVPDARLRPDVVGTVHDVTEPYPTRALDVAVEILSPNDSASYLLEKCQAYAAWGFEFIYVLDPKTKQLFRWRGSALEQSDTLTTIPVERIWQELETSLRRKQ